MARETGEVRQEQLDAEAEARRQLALGQIRQFGDPALRMRAREVEEFAADLARLADRMKRLMVEANGVGLAATQVGILQRLFVFQPGQDEDIQALVNPRIVARSDEIVTDPEGCLSLQGVLVPVERSAAVTVEARTPSGDDVRLDLENLAARVAQHEVDHLDGVLILDRTTPDSRREALGVLRPEPLLTPQ